MWHIPNKKGICAHIFNVRALDAKQRINLFWPKPPGAQSRIYGTYISIFGGSSKNKICTSPRERASKFWPKGIKITDFVVP